MEYYLKKFAVSGTISAVFFAGFLYFVYDAESAKYEEKKTGEPTKQYEESIIAQVNSEVAKTMKGLSREGYALAEWQKPSTQPHDQNTPAETAEIMVSNDAAPQFREIAKILCLRTISQLRFPQLRKFLPLPSHRSPLLQLFQAFLPSPSQVFRHRTDTRATG